MAEDLGQLAGLALLGALCHVTVAALDPVGAIAHEDLTDARLAAFLDSSTPPPPRG
ncbi:hypothetical protein [Nocardioides mesophilus]|uniref:Uncharacterized protein n=1 Tax=Nocardioides mesophilus TaxID=433659 RepID=A0A7G9RA26_9ACTN|nr:hypothetical protein [Nocardioides mesophilus]QNN52451.1 hypothetical protein H9L09_18555 [Nocardioides mesophilus]